MSSSPRLRAKLSLIGDVSSGKTSLLYSFCKQKFLDQLDSTNTVFETYVTDINVDGLSVS
jgi:GTPase SAR1 family protein